MAVTKAWKVYGYAGHRQAESFRDSYIYDFSTEKETRVIEVQNSDFTDTNDYSVVIITCDSEYACIDEIEGQVSDGIFENFGVGKAEEIPVPEKRLDASFCGKLIIGD